MLLILFVRRIRSIIANPKAISNSTEVPNQTGDSPFCEYTFRSASGQLFYLSDSNLQNSATVEMLARIRSDLLTAALAQQQNNLNNQQQVNSNQLYVLNTRHPTMQSQTSNQTELIADLLRIELPPPSYSEVIKTGGNNSNIQEDKRDQPPPSYNQIKIDPNNSR